MKKCSLSAALTLRASVSLPTQGDIVPAFWGKGVGEAECQEEIREVYPNIKIKR